MLGIERSGTVIFQGMEDGSVRVTPKTDALHEDPALQGFLDLIKRDLAARPERLLVATRELRHRVAGLTEGVVVNMNAPLDSDDD